MRKPEECTEKAHIREEIDRIDKSLVALFAQRDAYVRRMAEIKSDPSEARVEARVKDVLDKVLAELEAVDLAPDLYMQFWEELIEVNIDYEAATIAARLADKNDTPGA
ncbi:isochorismate pyruvate lyase [Cohaesibacter sp. ES.047]|uniref:chorismate mutase n=1 Tax=Cohaesibacter sp. ES.047 TaxID=1798205 RepID=UPI000BB7F244|nr:chorismate mutase [Cohaesibacter sp. ES.047]SNY93896.1 isochorismate pyruvate lyase [Cohaesibacter sp. ES.047]